MKHYIGIDIGGTHIALGVVDETGKILVKSSLPAGADIPFETTVSGMADAAKQLTEEAGLNPVDIAAVGIGVPSTIDPRTKRVYFANNLNWRDLDLLGEFKKHWNTAVFLENDADCAALGETIAGYGGNYRNVVLVTIGTGFGGGIILDGKLFKGGDDSGVEPGHMALVFDGLLCTCGLRGCLEAYASVTALIRQTKEKMAAFPESLMWKLCGGNAGRVDARTAFDASKQGDPAAVETVREFTAYAAAGIGNLITLFRPNAVIVGGGLSNEGGCLLDPLYEETKRRIYAPELMPPILRARLGNDAGIVGAALLARQ